MDDPIPTFSHVLHELVKRHPNLSYVHFVEPPEPTPTTEGQAHDTGSVTVCSFCTSYSPLPLADTAYLASRLERFCSGNMGLEDVPQCWRV